MFKTILLLASHGAMLAVGFALGIYLLPTLTAPESPVDSQLQAVAQTAAYKTTFTRELDGSDFLHWGEGEVSLSETAIVLQGEIAPGPDYQLYLAPSFVENEAQFEAIKSSALRVGPVKTFENFMLELPAGVDLAAYSTVVIWCESFAEFITAGQYR